MLDIRAAYAVTRCPSVRVSVTFVDSLQTNKHIFNFFSPWGSHTILILHTERYGNIPTGPTNWGNKNLAIANRSRVSCAHNTLMAFIGLNITP